jgi:putative ubiquitin-RnfH superfamily antitoxin RatB of RatAB toxin-antitoxin module
MSATEIEVEIVYALPLAQDVDRLRVPAGTTVAEAIERSAIPSRHPGAGVNLERVAVLGRLAAPDTVLHDLDRIEILRPLTIDPKEARRLRASTRRRRANKTSTDPG